MPDKNVAPGLCFRQSFQLFEQLAEASHGWDMDFRQLSANSVPYQLEQLSTAQMLYSRVHFDSHFHQVGGPVLGFRTFALASDTCSDFRWCGEAVNRQSLIVLPSDGEFESVSLPGFNIFTLSLSNALLERTAQTQFHRPLSDFIHSGRQVCHLPGERLWELRALLSRLSDDMELIGRAAESVHQAVTIRRLERELAMLVLACLDRGANLSPNGTRGKRMKVLARAMEVFEHRGPRETRVTDLVAMLGVSRRTLEHAFQDCLGVSPAAYFKATRLRALHKTLLVADRNHTSVQKLCSQFGFTHHGQLAADYRKLFGELPFATLRRA